MSKMKFKTKFPYTAVPTSGLCPQRHVIKIHQRFRFCSVNDK